MSTQKIVDIISAHTREVIPELESHQFHGTDNLKDLGANSMDRSEIIMMTLDTLSLQVPLVEMVGAENIEELATIIYEKSA
jgi:polyketide biosynthesis acyl carrier protein